MAVVMARQVRDGENVAVGALSPVPAAAVLLAQATHAPHINLTILGSQEYHPFPTGSAELHFMAQRGDLDLFFLSGLQIDRHGNVNLHVLGDYRRPRLRTAGAFGSALIYYMAKRVVLFRTEHTRRSLVERVDFVTAPGMSSERVHRPGGPALLVTPRAVFGFDKGKGEWALDALHPGVTLEEVRANTGFEVAVPVPPQVTSLPTEEELRVLRGAVRERVAPIYPDFAATKLLPSV